MYSTYVGGVRTYVCTYELCDKAYTALCILQYLVVHTANLKALQVLVPHTGTMEGLQVLMHSSHRKLKGTTSSCGPDTANLKALQVLVAREVPH